MGQPRHQRRYQLGVDLLDQVAEDVLGHARAGHRGDGVDLDVVLGALLGEHPGEADQTHLGGAVVGLAEVAEDPRVGRGVDDPPVVLLPHLQPRRLRDPERPLEVDVEHGVHHVGLHVVERLVPQDAGVVDDDVDPPECVEGRLHDGGAALGRRDRVGVGDGFAAQVLDLFDDCLRRPGAAALAVHRPAEVVDHNEGAPRRQQERVLPPESAAGACDDCYFSVEPEISHEGRG